MKNAGKACNNRLYRHIRTFEKIIKNYFVIFLKKLLFKEKTGKISKVTEPKRKLGDEKCETGFAD